MSKIAIISRPDEGVLIDVGGCANMEEATQHLTSTLQVSSQFWKGVSISLNLGELELDNHEVAQILSIASGVGAAPSEVFAKNDRTRLALKEHNVKLGEGEPVALPEATSEITTLQDLSQEEDQPDEGELVQASFPEDKDGPSNGQKATSIVGNSPKTEVDTIHTVKEKEEVSLSEARPKALPAVLYLKQTLRSGQMVSHKGHLVIIGDVNPGAEVMAEGDVTVWGALRGIAHAGIGGNIHAEIRALKLQPIQIRIAHVIARAPDKPRLKYPSQIGPEVAKIMEGKIRITRNNIE